MFVRVKEKPNGFRKSVQIIKSIRYGDTTRQKIIKHVGVAYNEEELHQLKMLAESIKKDIETEGLEELFSPEEMNRIIKESEKIKRELGSAQKKEGDIDDRYLVDIRNSREEQRVIKGIHDIYGKLHDELGYNKIIKNPARNKSANKIFKDIVLARIANPASKKESVINLEEKFGISLDLNKVYRMMDKLDDKAIEKLKTRSCNNTLKLFNNQLDIIFFDCTTIYFESFTEDELKNNGFSKDLKFNQPQVLLALMVTKEGLPVSYELFEGNKYEGHTLISSLEKLKEKNNIGKVVFVADGGMFNKENLIELGDKNYEYIVGCRLKSLPKKTQEKILDHNNYKAINDEYKIGRFPYQHAISRNDFQSILTNEHQQSGKIFTELKAQGYIDGNGNVLDKFHANMTTGLILSEGYKSLADKIVKILKELSKTKYLIVNYSKKRARKDEFDREKAIEKIKKKLEGSKNPQEYIANHLYKKYIKVENAGKIELNEKKIQEEKKWDGLHGTITNTSELSDQEVLAQYTNLWQVENAFRITKHDVKVRPVFHWKPRRIKAHIAICYTAYSLMRYLEYRVKLQYKKMSPEAIRKTLVDVQASIVCDIKKNIRYCLPSNVSPEAKKIYKLFNLNLSQIPFLLKDKMFPKSSAPKKSAPLIL